MGLGSNYTTGLNSCNWCDRSNNDLPPPRPRFQYDKSRGLSSDHWDMNTICLNVNKKIITEFNSVPETAKHFGVYQRYRDDIPEWLQDNIGDIWVVLHGDIPEEKRAWFDNPETLFDTAVDTLPERHRIVVKKLLRHQ